MSFVSKYLDMEWAGEPPYLPLIDEAYEYTKVRSAINQILSAIELLFEGRYDSALTLAGAAEGMLPKTKHSSHEMFMNMPVPQGVEYEYFGLLDRSERNSFLNKQRDWLKHNNEKQEETQVISRVDAGGMIFRAITHLPDVEVPPEIHEVFCEFFKLWFYDTGWKKPLSDK